jgi:hypothetical protein
MGEIRDLQEHLLEQSTKAAKQAIKMFPKRNAAAKNKAAL